MTRAQLEHIIRAAAAISGDDEIIVVGSQSILGAFPAAPAALRVSMEADVYPKHHPEQSDLIDGSIGEGSIFHDTFGYYAQGVGPETATLPADWEERLIPVRNENTRGATGWTLDPHDLAIAKYVANREKDRHFLSVAVSHGLLKKTVLLERLAKTSLDEAGRTQVKRAVESDFSNAKP